VVFGAALRKARLNRGISQDQLAQLASINRSYVGDVERGTRNISLQNMSRLARALKMTLSDLVKELD
jgi:transcriptional regulator with XRE-family HTH domain